MAHSLSNVNEIQDQVLKLVEEERAEFAGEDQAPGKDNGASTQPSCFAVDLTKFRAGRFLEKEPEPLVYHFEGSPGSLLAGSTGIIQGDGSVGKGTLLIQAAISTATGRPFLNGLFSANTPGKALLICAEDPENILHHRFYRIVDSLTETSFDRRQLVEAIRDNIISLSVSGRDARLMASSPKGGTAESAAFLDLMEQVVKLDGLRFIGLDPTSRLYGADENDPDQSTFYMVLMEAIANQTGATVITNHHVSKGSQAGRSTVDRLTVHAGRGSTGFANAARWVLSMARVVEDEWKTLGISPDEIWRYVVAKVTKSNYSPTGAHFFLRRDDHGCLRHVALNHQSITAREEEVLNYAVSQLKEDQGKGISRTKRDFGRTYTKRWYGFGSRELETLIERAIAEGRIAVDSRLNERKQLTDYLFIRDGNSKETGDSAHSAHTAQTGCAE
jgi:RecA-family ATPase